MSTEQIFEKVRSILSENLGVEEDAVTMDANFTTT